MGVAPLKGDLVLLTVACNQPEYAARSQNVCSFYQVLLMPRHTAIVPFPLKIPEGARNVYILIILLTFVVISSVTYLRPDMGLL